MIWIVSCLLLILPQPISEEVKQFAEEAGKQVNEEAAAFLKDIYERAAFDAPARCKKCLPSSATAQIQTYNLMVFMSFSVPLESWKEWSHSLDRMGGVFILRGLPGNSFQTFAQKVKELRDAGVHTPISVDPESYEKYRIQSVPSIVLLEGEKHDRVAGNVRMETVLRIFVEKGDTKGVCPTLDKF